MHPNLRLPLASMLLSLLPFLAACRPEQRRDVPEEPAGAPVLRSYAVPSGMEKQTAQVVNNLMARGDETIGRALPGAAGLVVVLAPETVQEGVAGLIRQIESAKQSDEAIHTVEITYWLVLAWPKGVAKAPAAPDPRLAEIRTPLETIAAHHGGVWFELIERLNVSSIYDEHGQVSGRAASVRQRVARTGGSLHGEINVNVSSFNAAVLTSVNLRPDRFLVLGESGLSGRSSSGADLKGATLFYVIRPRIIDAE